MSISVLRIMLAPANVSQVFMFTPSFLIIIKQQPGPIPFHTECTFYSFYINNCTEMYQSQKQILGILLYTKYFSPSHSSPLLIIRALQTDAPLFTDGWGAGPVAHGSTLPSPLSTDYSSYTFPVIPELHSLQGKVIECYKKNQQK